MTLLLTWFLAHFTGDFLLQPHAMVEDKEEQKLASKYLYFHVIIHFALILVFTWDLTMWKPALYIAGSHLVIDALKVSLQNENTRRRWFYIDQLLHLAAISVIWAIYTNVDFSEIFKPALNGQTMLLALSIVFLTTPASAFVKNFISKWTPGKESEKENRALSDAGMYIGILERLLAFIFIITNHWSALGFLITAKSVFRFGDLRESHNREFTEYILIGTLMSFSIAVLIALLYLLLLPVLK